MGTRGIYGFYKNGVDKLTYNHFDSYPEGLGDDIVKFVRGTSIEELNSIFDSIILVNSSDTPTDEQINECRQYFDSSVSTGSEKEWYCLLRNTQGNLGAYKSGLRYMIDDRDFIKDSLFCEWGYIINLEDNTLEIYKKSSTGRYASRRNGGYYSCKMVKAFPLDNVPDNWLELLK